MKTAIGVVLAILGVAVVIALVVLLATGAVGPAGGPLVPGSAAMNERLNAMYYGAPPSGISINGEGLVKAKPDMATVQVVVDVSNKNVGEAQSDAATRMNNVMAKLKEQGVADDDIKTSQFAIYPQYDYTPGREQGTLVGYRVVNGVAVTIKQLDKVGKVLDAVVAAGATRVDSVAFSIADPTPLQSQARAAAVKQARTRAEELAKAAGVSLGKVTSISESTAGAIPEFASMTKAAALGAGDTPITPGSLEIRVNVQVNYAIQ